VRTICLGLVGDGPSGRRNYDKPADEHLPVGQVGTNVDKYGKVSSQGFPWRPIVATLLRARSSVSLRSGGSILQSKAGPFLASGEAPDSNGVFQVELPYFTADVAAASSQRSAGFRLFLRDSKTWNHIASNLEPEMPDLRRKDHGFQIRSRYPDGLRFTARTLRSDMDVSRRSRR